MSRINDDDVFAVEFIAAECEILVVSLFAYCGICLHFLF